MFSARPEDAQEGTDDRTPVVIPGIVRQEFDSFLDYQFRQYVHSSPFKRVL